MPPPAAGQGRGGTAHQGDDRSDDCQYAQPHHSLLLITASSTRTRATPHTPPEAAQSAVIPACSRDRPAYGPRPAARPPGRPAGPAGPAGQNRPRAASRARPAAARQAVTRRWPQVTDTLRVTATGSGRRGGWAVPARAPRSRDRASCGTGARGHRKSACSRCQCESLFPAAAGCMRSLQTCGVRRHRLMIGMSACPIFGLGRGVVFGMLLRTPAATAATSRDCGNGPEFSLPDRLHAQAFFRAGVQ